MSDKIKAIIEEQEKTIKRCQATMKWLQNNKATIESLDIADSVSDCGGQVDFDHLPRTKVIEVIKAFPGKWVKSEYEGMLSYVLASEKDGPIIRMWNAAKPNCCRVIEVDEELPAQPARTVKRRKLVCDPDFVDEVVSQT